MPISTAAIESDHKLKCFPYLLGVVHILRNHVIQAARLSDRT